MHVFTAAALLCAVALAGCAGESDPAPTADPNVTLGDDGELINQAQLPRWNVSDHWTYETSIGSTPTFVVSDISSGAYMIETDNVDLAFFEAEFGPISYMGPQRASDLAGSQDGGEVRFFDWPLEAGKQWTTPWDGETLDMIAHDIGNGDWHIIASLEDTIINEYVYDEAVQWFEWISFTDGQGNEVFRMDLMASGSDWGGGIVRVEAEQVSQGHYEGPTAQDLQLLGNLGVLSGDDADAFILFNVACTTGAFSFAIGTVESAVDSSAGSALGISEDQGFSLLGQSCPVAILTGGTIGETPANGEHWGVLMQSLSPDLLLDYTLYLRHIERITL